MRLVAPVFRLFGALAVGLVALYFVLATGLVAMRYVVLPQIDTWLPQIEQVTGEALGLKVEIRALSASWYRLHPELELEQVTLKDAAGRVVLELPRVRARLSWQTLVRQRPELLQLVLEAPRLSVRRQIDGSLTLAGLTLARPDVGDGFHYAAPLQSAAPAWQAAESPAMTWLRSQRDIRIEHAQVQWEDDTGQLPSATLDNVALQWHSGPLRGQRLALKVPGRFPGGESLDVRVRWRAGLAANLATTAGWADWRGEVYASVDRVDLAWWRPWLGEHAPSHLRGELAFRLWGELEADVAPQWQADLALRNLGWQGQPDGPALAVGDATVALQAREGEVLLDWQAHQGLVALPTLFDQTLPLELATGTATSRVDELATMWQFVDVEVHAGRPGERLGGVLTGEWRATPGSPLGEVNLQAELAHGEVGAVALFTPLQADPDVRQWLRGGLRAGSLESGRFSLRGPLRHFPFVGDAAPLGHFTLEAAVRDVAIDIVPDEDPGWPLLSSLAGRIVIEGDELRADVRQGQIRPDAEQHIDIQPSRLIISAMTTSPRVDVQAVTRGDGAAYLAWMTASPLRELLHEAPEGLVVTGELAVPVRVQVPLSDAADATHDLSVEGTVVFDGNQVVARGWPAPFERLTGEVQFSQAQVQFEGLRAIWLGDALTLEGEALANGTARVDWRGVLRPSNLQAWLPESLAEVPEGQAPYRGQWQRGGDGRVAGTIRTDLVGMALHLPPPLGKAGDSLVPLLIEWQRPAGQQAILAQWSLGDGFYGGLRWLPGAAQPEALAVSFDDPVDLPAAGWQIDLGRETLDLDRWWQWWQAQAPSVPSGSGEGLPWSGWPKPVRVQLASPSLHVGEEVWPDVELALEITRNDLLRLRVDSPHLAGWLGWSPATAAGPARIEARLDRLHIQPSVTADDDAPAAVRRSESRLARLPYVDLRVDDLRWRDMALGALDIEAHPLDGEGGWRFADLQLQNPALSLVGQGSWQVAAATRTGASSTTLQWQGEIHDVGTLLGRLGVNDVVAGGMGQFQGSARWPGAPWDLALPDLVAELRLELEEGRFLPVSDGAGRLLSVLSLQTLARTVTFQNEDLFASGFAWDSLRSSAMIDHGQMQISGFDMRGNSAAALMSGSVNLVDETQTLSVLILPRIDASGAALLAGVAINPIVGVGAFLTQWLLREPLARVLSLEYDVTGSWDDPQVQRRREAARGDAPRVEPVP